MAESGAFPQLPDGSEMDNAYQELQCYTLTRGDSTFIHQHVVDAWAAQHAGANTKKITLAFALIGLYLHVDKGFSGKQVQRVHMQLARRKEDWPSFPLPHDRGHITALDVMLAPEGPERDQAIDAWCASVWIAFGESHQSVVRLLEQHGINSIPGNPTR